MNDLRVARDRHKAISDLLDASQPADLHASAAEVGTTTTIDSYPTAAAAYYGVTIGNLTGAEVEGGSDSVKTIGATVVALNVGTKVPPEGTSLVIHAVGGRYVFRYDG